MVGILVSFWEALFSGAMLVSGSVCQAICQVVRDIYRKSCIRYTTGKLAKKKTETTMKFPWPRPLPSMLEFRKWKRPADRNRSEGRKLPKKMVAGRHVSDKKEAVAVHDTGCFIGILITNGFFITIST